MGLNFSHRIAVVVIILASGCMTTRSQQKSALLDQTNQLSLKAHSLEQENQSLRQQNMEGERTITQLEDHISDLEAKLGGAPTPPHFAQQKTKISTVTPPLPAYDAKLTKKNIQKALKSAGYDIGEIDGKIGPRTREAISTFQKANGLTPDGKVGNQTWAKLQTYLPASDQSKSTSVKPDTH
jgi:murein L,D-transpeptidase YcbB/YkuD